MLVGFHFGTFATVHATMSVIRRRLGAGGNTYVPRDRYSLMMSFWVVPASLPTTSCQSAPCASACSWASVT
jgi:hypothetical protein